MISLNGKNSNTNSFTKKHFRRTIRLKDYDYSKEGAYLVTICTWNREQFLSRIVDDKMMLLSAGEIVAKWWNTISGRFSDVELDESVIMPNHLHGIIKIVGAIHELPLHKSTHSSNQRRLMLLPKIIGFLKMNSSKHIRNINMQSCIWQRNYYERIIRNKDELNRVREYIYNNPQQWIYDKENHDRVKNPKYQKEWKWLEC